MRLALAAHGAAIACIVVALVLRQTDDLTGSAITDGFGPIGERNVQAAIDRPAVVPWLIAAIVEPREGVFVNVRGADFTGFAVVDETLLWPWLAAAIVLASAGTAFRRRPA